MEIRLAKDELAIVKWLYDRSRAFRREDGEYWANTMKSELGLTERRYRRAVSLLTGLNLVATTKGEIKKPVEEKGHWMHLTPNGVMAYRQLVSQTEWDTLGPWFDEVPPKPEEDE